MGTVGTKRQRNGHLITFEYDALSCNTKKSADIFVEYFYDAGGRHTSVIRNDLMAVTSEYDAAFKRKKVMHYGSNDPPEVSAFTLLMHRLGVLNPEEMLDSVRGFLLRLLTRALV